MLALRLGAAAAVAVLAAALSIAPAAAASPSSLVQTDSFAGYEVSKKTGQVTGAHAQFVVPKITCKKSLSGVGPAVFVITQTPAKKGKPSQIIESAAAVGVACEKGKVIYQAVYLVNGVETNDYFVKAGDAMTATVSVTPKGTSVFLRDVTAKHGKTMKGKGYKAYAAQIGNAGISFNNVAAGIDPFATTAFTNCSVSGKNLVAEGAFGAERVNKHGVVEMAPTKIVKKKNFKVVFKHS